MAAVWTDQEDYSPGSVVTISGDNSDGAGYLAGETVHVDVSGPNGYATACEGVADSNGAWSCQVTLWSDSRAVGDYSYTATGQTSGVTESGTFTDGNVKIASINGFHFNVIVTLYKGSTTCTGVAITPDAGTADSNGFTTGVGNNESVLVEASLNANAPNAAHTFSHWTLGSITLAAGYTSTNRIICVVGFQSGSRDLIGNYVANAAPVATNDSYSTSEDTPLTVAAPGVLANDTDANGNSLTATLVSGPANGAVVLNANGSFTYTPNLNYTGPDSFTYRANDGFANSNVATVSITVNPVNDPPSAVDDAYAVNEDDTLIMAAPGVLNNDADVDGPSLSAVKVSDPAHGTLTLNADGSFSYTPDANYNGTDSFTYKANDGTADSNVATVSITVGPVADAPVAVDDTTATSEDTPVDINVLANDSDAEGDALSVVAVTQGSHGAVTHNDTSVTYTPNANFHGVDTFTYQAQASGDLTNNATVTVNVTPVNDAPVAGDDSYTTGEDTPLVVAAPGVLNNDTDVELGALTAMLVSGPGNGELTLNADGSFSYTPDPDFNGVDGFTYTANDSKDASNPAIVTITVNPINDAPTAANDNYLVDEDSTLNEAVPGVLDNDNDVDGDDLTAVLVADVTKGTLTLNADGSFTYTPNDNFHGSDSFTYKTNDGDLDSNVATVTITVAAVNDAPVAVADTETTDEDTPVTIHVLANDADVDGDELTAAVASGPSHGAVTLNPDGSFTYTPAANYNGPDSFTYQANDGALDSNVATVSITVTAINDAPVVSVLNATVTVDEGQVATNSGTWSDVDSANVTLSASSGVVVQEEDGTWTWSFAATDGPNQSQTVTITADDGALETTATFALTVENVAPTLTISGAASVNEGSEYTLGLAASDPGADTITGWTINWGDGAVENVDGNPTSATHTYADGPNSYIISATATDEDGTFAANTLAVAINNVAPTVSLNGPASADEGQIKTYTFSVTDPGDDTFTVATGFPDCGTGGSLVGASLVINGSGGSFQCHFPDGPATPSVRIQVTDSDGADSNTAAILVTVTNVAPVVELTGPASADEGETETYSFSVSDPGTDGFTVTDTTCGVGGVLAGLVAVNAGGGSFNCTFPDGPDNPTVSVTVEDDDTASNSDTVAVTVANIAPTATFNAPATVNEGSSIDLSLTDALDPSSADTTVGFTYAFDCGDGSGYGAFSASNMATCPTSDNGTRTVKGQIMDKDGGFTEHIASVTIDNVAPEVTINGAPASSPEGTPINLTSTVVDPGTADTHTYAWSVTKDGGAYAFGTGSMLSFTPNDNGTYVVSLTVTDDDGGSGSDSKTIEVINVAPTATINGVPASSPEGTLIPLTGSVSDPGAADTHTVAWTVTKNGGAYASGAGSSFSFTPDDNGTYVVTLTVTDDDGGVGTDSQTVTITNVAPVVIASPVNGDEGSPVTQTASFTDAGTADTHTCSIDWGDGSLATAGTVVETVGSGTGTCSGSHTYADNGNYTITVTVTDDELDSGLDGDTAAIANVAPTLTIDGDAEVDEGSLYTLELSSSDPGADTIASWTINWGDGAIETVSGNPSSTTHIYADGPNDFTITATATDEDGSFNANSLDVSIQNVAPTVDLTGADSANEGETKTYTFSVNDPGDDTFTVATGFPDCGTGGVLVAGSLQTDPDGGSFDCAFPDGPANPAVSITVEDDDSASDSDTVAVTVANIAPAVNAGASATVTEGGTFIRGGAFIDPGADTWTATVDYGDGSPVEDLDLAADKTFSLSHVYVDDGTYTVNVCVTDDDLGDDCDMVIVTVENVAPASISLTAAPATINENESVTLSGSFTDPGAQDTYEVVIDWGDGSSNTTLSLGVGVRSFAAAHQYLDDNPTGTQSDVNAIQVTITDDDNGAGSANASATVKNVAPEITDVTGPTGPLALGTAASVSVTFTDVGTQDSHTCTFAWDDDTADMTVAATGGACTGTHTYAAPGVYEVSVTVTDDDTGSDTAVYEQYIVIYNAQGGFVTGGGFINSPSGAYTADPSLTGKATFGFVSKYLRGANTPTGQTEFNFSVARFNFHSSSYQWLVVSGAKAQYKGSGTVNGVAGYSFLLTATDGQVNGGGGTDKFRIKIWETTTDTIVYDNALGHSDDIDAANPQAISGGSIVIHR